MLKSQILETTSRPGTPAELVRLEQVHKAYTRGLIAVPVLNGVTLSIRQGEMVALMGASGSGKTTLINLLGFLDRPTSGCHIFDGNDVTQLGALERARLRNQKIGFVFQNFHLLPRMSALENVTMPLLYGAHSLPPRECRARARALLLRVGLGDRMAHEPAQLSGGEQQRVAIARALISRCSFLIADEPTGNLDSATGEEILALLRQLNREDGVTIILVTHDPNVAAHADRIIRIRDGLVFDDDRSEDLRGDLPVRVQAPVTNRPGRPPGKAVRSSPASELRLVGRTVSTAFSSLRRNALRSALTALGIIIGVGSLLAIAEIGTGAWSAIRDLLTKTGVDNIVVQPGAASRNGVSLGSGSIKTLTPGDAETIARECASVDSLAPLVFTRRQVVHGNRNWVPATFVGTTPGYLRVRDWQDLAEGEPLTDQDVSEVAMVCLLGQTIAHELFGDESPLGKEVYANDVPLKVIGVLARKGADIIGEDQDDILVVPWTTVKYRVSASAGAPAAVKDALRLDPAEELSLMARRYPRGQTDPFPTQSAIQAVDIPRLQRLSNIDSILVRAMSTEEIPDAMEQITRVLRRCHKLGPAEANDFSVRDFTEVIHAVRGTVEMVAGLLLLIALIALIVGGIGIMNIMLVTVTERYREIGLRMAVGARAHDILRQFLVEAIVLCLLGGAVGIAAGRSASVLVRLLAQWPTQTSYLAMVLSVAISVTVGLIFGYYPAWKASQLDPIEALRFD
jgi:macrolide transport system ATP-binding/permease protein